MFSVEKVDCPESKKSPEFWREMRQLSFNYGYGEMREIFRGILRGLYPKTECFKAVFFVCYCEGEIVAWSLLLLRNYSYHRKGTVMSYTKAKWRGNGIQKNHLLPEIKREIEERGFKKVFFNSWSPKQRETFKYLENGENVYR